MNNCLVTYVEKDIFKPIENKNIKNHAVTLKYENLSREPSKLT